MKHAGALVLFSLLSGCVSTRIIEVGGGQFMAMVSQRGGIPDEGSMIETARNAAAERCGGIQNLRVADVSSNSQASQQGNEGNASVRFFCVSGPVASAR